MSHTPQSLRILEVLVKQDEAMLPAYVHSLIPGLDLVEDPHAGPPGGPLRA
jgi:hypothetical protein